MIISSRYRSWAIVATSAIEMPRELRSTAPGTGLQVDASRRDRDSDEIRMRGDGQTLRDVADERSGN